MPLLVALSSPVQSTDEEQKPTQDQANIATGMKAWPPPFLFFPNRRLGDSRVSDQQIGSSTKLLMAKPKSQHTGKKKKNQGAPELDPADEDCWVMVKKQRVTILIPPLSGKEQSIKPNMADRQIQEKPGKTNSEPQCPSGTGVQMHSAHEREKSISVSPEEDLPPANIVHPSEPVLPSELQHGDDLGNSPIHSFREDEMIGFGSTSQMSKRLMIFLDTSTLLNRRMRALYFEKKLQRAGGLNNWLVSLGLGRFITIFQSRSVNKFQLANLTMKKLKDMGAVAVGPRRKLMHAIDCLCQPHCFKYS
ncbi:uncharacterized protein Fot_55705 [Forsythia ovata]|uniref:SAM domain-containing protein n=2 Tax=Forsythia ovata TaxID=205694 RepID=A0ABD1P3J0_9LAMI